LLDKFDSMNECTYTYQQQKFHILWVCRKCPWIN